METINIGITFKSLEECEKWEEKNFPNRTYNGRMILCVNHTQNAGEKEITLDSVMVF